MHQHEGSQRNAYRDQPQIRVTFSHQGNSTSNLRNLIVSFLEQANLILQQYIFLLPKADINRGMFCSAVFITIISFAKMLVSDENLAS
ncbi:hypothetical protein L211DRAFT_369760 [Terfezia boudieri ATCC MYA-4762]|uniref:Uncharacterized protein n=1 Tax=Terfezia boudieri ATCC MYA-4762 TaxID=1051890 RepID=A0A3N4LZB8_9PEZI|nr:hypothetical protein L211DRAFT_369760 [Terfezia boudieri ATCC MYA-4762]